MTIQGLELYEIDLYIFGLSLSQFVCFHPKKCQNQSSQNVLMDLREVFKKGTNGKCLHVKKKTLKNPKEGSESS